MSRTEINGLLLPGVRYFIINYAELVIMRRLEAPLWGYHPVLRLPHIRSLFTPFVLTFVQNCQYGLSVPWGLEA